jgi:hypothetical protein
MITIPIIVAQHTGCVDLLATKRHNSVFASIANLLTFFCAEYLMEQKPVEDLLYISAKDLTKEGKERWKKPR